MRQKWKKDIKLFEKKQKKDWKMHKRKEKMKKMEI